MKKRSLFFIGAIVLVMSVLSEFALSMMKEEQWSNYVQNWETPWKKYKKLHMKKGFAMKKPSERQMAVYGTLQK